MQRKQNRLNNGDTNSQFKESGQNPFRGEEAKDNSTESEEQRIESYEMINEEDMPQGNRQSLVRVENEGYSRPEIEDRPIYNSSPLEGSSSSFPYLRISEEEAFRAENMELPSEKGENTDTEEFNCGSIPDEVESMKNGQAEEVVYQSDNNLSEDQPLNESQSIKCSNTLENSKKFDSIEDNSIFASENLSNSSSPKRNEERDILEVCKEMNNMAVELIKQGTALQEGDDEDNDEEENETEEDERQIRAENSYSKAKAYLDACLEHAENKQYKHRFDPTFWITIHYNLGKH